MKHRSMQIWKQNRQFLCLMTINVSGNLVYIECVKEIIEWLSKLYTCFDGTCKPDDKCCIALAFLFEIRNM